MDALAWPRVDRVWDNSFRMEARCGNIMRQHSSSKGFKRLGGDGARQQHHDGICIGQVAVGLNEAHVRRRYKSAEVWWVQFKATNRKPPSAVGRVDPTGTFHRPF